MSDPSIPLPATYTANLYPASPAQGVSSPVTGVCFSGGGSRALTCALGQLSALNSMGLLSRFNYISSVSGGSWASVLYTFLPTTISDSQFLIAPDAPNLLTAANMQSMAAQCLGSVP